MGGHGGQKTLQKGQEEQGSKTQSELVRGFP